MSCSWCLKRQVALGQDILILGGQTPGSIHCCQMWLVGEPLISEWEEPWSSLCSHSIPRIDGKVNTVLLDVKSSFTQVWISLIWQTLYGTCQQVQCSFILYYKTVCFTRLCWHLSSSWKWIRWLNSCSCSYWLLFFWGVNCVITSWMF